MPKATAPLFGRLFRAFRKRAGLIRQTLAAFLHVAPATISKIETGRKNPPLDAPFYERLRGFPGFTPAEVTLLLEAREADKSTGELLAQLKTTLERLRNPLEAAKANQHRAILLAHYLEELGRLAASGEQYLWEVMESLRNMENDLPDELEPIGQKLIQTLTRAYAEYLTLSSVMVLEGITRTREQAPQALPIPGEEEALNILTKSVHKRTRKRSSISSPVKPEIPDHYPHTSVPEHARQVVGEGNWQQAPEKGVVYKRRHSRDKTGQEVPEQLMTVQDLIDTLQLPPRTVWSWFSTGRLKERGRVWLAKPGGRGSPLVSKAQAESLKNERPPRGRPPKGKRKG